MAELRWFEELHRRHVVRAAVVYAAAVWALAQGIAQLSPTFDLPSSVTLWFVIVCAIGFPFWLAFAWYFRFTAHGIERESETVENEAAVRRTGRKLDYWIIGILAVAVVLLLANQLVLQRGKTIREFTTAPAVETSFSPPAGSIVVLPFKNLSGNPKQQYFSDGITEELTGALGQSTGLTVIAWDTAAHYRDSTETPADIGKALNVAHILGGSIQRAGDEVRVSAELVSTVSGRQLWSAHYDEPFKNIFAVQDKISAAIAGALKVKFAGMQAAPTLNPQAHELYLKGLAAVDRFTAVDAQTAQKYFQQALKLDPNYADAWAGLAYTWVQLSEVSTLPLQEALPKIRAAARKALALDPHNVNALVELGNADDNDNRIAEARAEYEHAITLDPSNAHAHMDYGLVLPPKQSLAQFHEATRLNPDNAVAQLNLASGYQELGDWAGERTAAQAMIELSPHGIDGAFLMAYAYTQLQRGEDAVKAFDLVQPSTALDRQLADAGRLTYQALLQPALRPKALAALDNLRRARISPDSQHDLIPLYLALGEKDIALQMLPEFCAADPVFCNGLAVNPMWTPLRGDPRFEKLSKHYTTITLGSSSVPASAN